MTGGWFRVGPHNSGGPNLHIITATISEIALGMEFLHSQGIVHGDLSSGDDTLHCSAEMCICALMHVRWLDCSVLNKFVSYQMPGFLGSGGSRCFDQMPLYAPESGGACHHRFTSD